MQSKVDIPQIIHQLERRGLDGAQLTELPVWGRLDNSTFAQVAGLSAFWVQEEGCRFEQYMEDVVTGFHGQGLPFVYFVHGQRTCLGVYVGVRGTPEVLEGALRGTFPAIELGDRPIVKIGSVLKSSVLFNHSGRLTGIPTLKAAQKTERAGSVQQIERLLRGLYGEEWGYLVEASPVAESRVTQMAADGFAQIRQVSALVKQTVRLDASTTGEQNDRQAQYCVELLERNLERLNRGKSQGMWRVEVTFFAADATTLARCKALLRSIFAGEDSVPEPIRTFHCIPGGVAHPPESFFTLLNSPELATLAPLPREEMPGYRVREHARFGVDSTALPSGSAADIFNLGKIQDGGRPTGNWWTLRRTDLAKHGLVVGVTGGGKTNTLFYLLDKLWDKGQGTPFLVIEPAKTEYRDLRTVPGFEALRVFTLGDERLAPLRLNPFEFEVVGAEHRIHVQTHIDYLKSLFNAVFILYAPMPYILESCLHEIYQDRGWDLTTGQNRRLPPQERGNEAQWPVFPTLTDLYNKVDEVVNRLGYDTRIQMDVKAGLKARIGSLRLGGKGLMLDVRRSLPMRELLDVPTVLELERIGNDDEKAFLIGLLLTRLYEYRTVQAMTSMALPPLQHVTVIEEAHRLLKNVSTEVGTEESNVKGQSVETFANMLSEIRAYGEGILIAEQVPTKLATDAIKNTNLKVMHRVVAEDDRRVMGGAMNLEEPQERYVSTLSTGEAVMYGEGMDKSFLVRVPNFKGTRLQGRVREKQVRGAMQPFLKQYTAFFEPVMGYSQYVQPYGQPISEVRDSAYAILDHPEWEESFRRYFLSLIANPRQAVYGYHELVRLAERVARPTPHQAKPIALYVMLNAIAELLEARGRLYGWFYNIVESLRQELAAVLCDIVLHYENKQSVLKQLVTRHEAALRKFAHAYRQLCSKAPVPYAGCMLCLNPCLYRYEVAPLLQDPRLIHDFEVVKKETDDNKLWQGLTALCREAAERAAQGISRDEQRGIALCYAAQLGPSHRWNPANQKRLVQNINKRL